MLTSVWGIYLFEGKSHCFLCGTQNLVSHLLKEKLTWQRWEVSMRQEHVVLWEAPAAGHINSFQVCKAALRGGEAWFIERGCPHYSNESTPPSALEGAGRTTAAWTTPCLKSRAPEKRSLPKVCCPSELSVLTQPCHKQHTGVLLLDPLLSEGRQAPWRDSSCVTCSVSLAVLNRWWQNKCKHFNHFFKEVLFRNISK